VVVGKGVSVDGRGVAVGKGVSVGGKGVGDGEGVSVINNGVAVGIINSVGEFSIVGISENASVACSVRVGAKVGSGETGGTVSTTATKGTLVGCVGFVAIVALKGGLSMLSVRYLFNKIITRTVLRDNKANNIIRRGSQPMPITDLFSLVPVVCSAAIVVCSQIYSPTTQQPAKTTFSTTIEISLTYIITDLRIVCVILLADPFTSQLATSGLLIVRQGQRSCSTSFSSLVGLTSPGRKDKNG
jgi:primosomal replication protein N